MPASTAFSTCRHPHERHTPCVKLYVSVSVVFPQSQIHFHIRFAFLCPDTFNTVKRPKRIPIKFSLMFSPPYPIKPRIFA